MTFTSLFEVWFVNSELEIIPSPEILSTINAAVDNLAEPFI